MKAWFQDTRLWCGTLHCDARTGGGVRTKQSEGCEHVCFVKERTIGFSLLREGCVLVSLSLSESLSVIFGASDFVGFP